jgi:hypothetical protein
MRSPDVKKFDLRELNDMLSGIERFTVPWDDVVWSGQVICLPDCSDELGEFTEIQFHLNPIIRVLWIVGQNVSFGHSETPPRSFAVSLPSGTLELGNDDHGF